MTQSSKEVNKLQLQLNERCVVYELLRKEFEGDKDFVVLQLERSKEKKKTRRERIIDLVQLKFIYLDNFDQMFLNRQIYKGQFKVKVRGFL